MSYNAGAAISVRVDPANPGQFFACCGLFELADRLWPGAEAWFEENAFVLRTAGELKDLIAAVVSAQVEEVTMLGEGLLVKPLIAPLRLAFADSKASFTIDYWMRVGREKGKVAALANPPWNFWSGQQTPLRIWRGLRDALRQQIAKAEALEETLFEERIPLSGRFGFDPGAAWTALDEGFSPNDQSIPVDSSPLVEMFSALGLQRFRPRLDENRREVFYYATWSMPLAPTIAAAAASGTSMDSAGTLYRGVVMSRGSYAALGYSVPN